MLLRSIALGPVGIRLRFLSFCRLMLSAAVHVSSCGSSQLSVFSADSPGASFPLRPVFASWLPPFANLKSRRSQLLEHHPGSHTPCQGSIRMGHSRAYVIVYDVSPYLARSIPFINGSRRERPRSYTVLVPGPRWIRDHRLACGEAEGRFVGLELVLKGSWSRCLDRPRSDAFPCGESPTCLQFRR